MPRKTSDKKQLEILQYIYDTVEKRSIPPTVREICSAVGLSSTSTVHGHLARLERKGWLVKDATKPRALEITREGKRVRYQAKGNSSYRCGYCRTTNSGS